MPIEPYNELVRACFAHPDHAGDLQGRYDSVCSAEVTESENGARLLLQVGIRDKKIAEMRFRVWGCPYLIAAAETVCADKENMPIATLQVFAQNELMQRLSVPDEKLGRMLLLEDALLTLAAQINVNIEQD
ncbi:MAG: iron-sulfur cluster assembly scaffold protein [Woeseiaceae bacterium]